MSHGPHSHCQSTDGWGASAVCSSGTFMGFLLLKNLGIRLDNVSVD
jgi:hypothetical protein